MSRTKMKRTSMYSGAYCIFLTNFRNSTCLSLMKISLMLTLQDPRLRESLMVGATDVPLEDKMVTIAYGIDMVNVSYISFAATTKAIAQVLDRFTFSAL